MRFFRTSLPFLALLLAFAAGPLAAQAVRGRVLDARGGTPIAQATVSAVSEDGRVVARTRSGDDGAFELDMRRAGTYRLRAERLGYQPSSSEALGVDLRETVEVDLRLSTETLAVAPLTVTARRGPPRRRTLEMNGYYDRERRGLGKFIRREDFERHQNYRATRIIGRVPGMRVVVDRRGREWVVTERSAGLGGMCGPSIYLDGARIIMGSGLTLNDVINPENIEAIEVYRGPSEVPPMYNDDRAACGVVLIWTRTER